jgi:hypothetical protein
MFVVLILFVLIGGMYPGKDIKVVAVGEICDCVVFDGEWLMFECDLQVQVLLWLCRVMLLHFSCIQWFWLG